MDEKPLYWFCSFNRYHHHVVSERSPIHHSSIQSIWISFDMFIGGSPVYFSFRVYLCDACKQNQWPKKRHIRALLCINCWLPCLEYTTISNFWCSICHSAGANCIALCETNSELDYRINMSCFVDCTYNPWNCVPISNSGPCLVNLLFSILQNVFWLVVPRFPLASFPNTWLFIASMASN